MRELHFTQRYCESLALPDGTRIYLRLVRPEDKPLLQAGLQRMSPDSRYRRFLGAKNRLTDSELAYLTECDGYDHLAIGAVTRDADGQENGIGVARFIRSPSDPGAAEAAIAVVDDWQNRGVGTLLLMRLSAAARERGILRFQGRALTRNYPIRDILQQLGPGVRTTNAAEELRIEVDLPDIPHDAPLGWPEPNTPLSRILSMAAKGAVLAQRLLSRHEQAASARVQ